MSDKTEEATPRRLRKAQEEGDSGASMFAAQSVAFLVAVALVPGVVRALAGHATDDLRAVLAAAAAHEEPDRERALAVDVKDLLAGVFALSAPIVGAVALVAAVATIVQTGGVFATKKLAPDLARLDPIRGLAQLFSGARLFAVLRALAFAVVVFALAARALEGHALDLAHLEGRLDRVAPFAGEVAFRVARDAALVGLALGAVDLLVTRRGWRKRLRMSKDEVKREHKESEGDPHVKQARERAHKEVLASAAVASVQKATVLVVNPTHRACALRYDEESGDGAPVVVARGDGELARKMIDAARAYGVPVVRDVPLSRALADLEVGDAIPEALYEAVAEILRDAWEDQERERKR